MAGLIAAVPNEHKEFLRNLAWVYEQVCFACFLKYFRYYQALFLNCELWKKVLTWCGNVFVETGRRRDRESRNELHKTYGCSCGAGIKICTQPDADVAYQGRKAPSY